MLAASRTSTAPGARGGSHLADCVTLHAVLGISYEPVTDHWPQAGLRISGYRVTVTRKRPRRLALAFRPAEC
jgi:hypothetical protein